MARKSRVEFEGAFYRVIVRGNQRRKIFRDEEDRLSYLTRVEHYRERYGFTLYAYVLMSNHFHLLIETVERTLSRGMQALTGDYARDFNDHRGCWPSVSGAIHRPFGREGELFSRTLTIHRPQSRAATDGRGSRAVAVEQP